MRKRVIAIGFTLVFSASNPAAVADVPPAPQDPIKALVAQLNLGSYQASIAGLAEFGDRRQGTQRNARALDWIEAQLKRVGCSDIQRLRYNYVTPPSTPRAATATAPLPATLVSGEVRTGVGGSRYRGVVAPTGVNTDAERQPDARLRELNREPALDGPREELWCTKIGTTHPDQMYLVSAHMDGHGWGEAVNDNGSGTALVMELARVFSAPGVRTGRSIRFLFWNNEETGLDGAKAYIAQRQALQGVESPKGSGRYPEPTWLAVFQHDMMLWDHGMPRADGSPNPQQRPEADINIEFQSRSKHADAAMKLAFLFRDANETYASDYPAAVGPHMTNTDSVPFMDLIPALSLRENERGMHTGAGWNPTWHQPSDVMATFSDADFRLGLNAAQTTLAAVARLAETSLEP